MRPFVSGLALAASLLAGTPGGAAEPGTTLELLWMRPPAGTAACTRLLVVEAPRDWLVGDAAAVVLTAGHVEESLAARVTEALLAQQAAVVRLRAGPGGGIGDCAAAAPDPTAELLGVLGALRHQAGAGLVVAIGLGAPGPVALAAAEEQAAARILGPGGPRLAAAVAMGGDGPAAFRAGPPPPADERWGDRAPLLCAAIDPLAGPGGGAACLEALVGQGRALASLRPRR